jgi:hypothetical protein
VLALLPIAASVSAIDGPTAVSTDSGARRGFAAARFAGLSSGAFGGKSSLASGGRGWAVESDWPCRAAISLLYATASSPVASASSVASIVAQPGNAKQAARSKYKLPIFGLMSILVPGASFISAVVNP